MTALLATFDRQLRGVEPETLPDGERLERLGPLVCVFGSAGQGFVDYRDLGGLAGAELDDLIASCMRAYAERGEPFEWKTYAHDEPADLPERLVAAGFVPEEPETVMIAEVAAIAGEPVLPDGLSLREVTERADFERIASLAHVVWGDDHAWLPDMLGAERAVDPDSLTVVVAEAGDEVVCSGWIRSPHGTEFGTLWGGSTHPDWRRRGIYRATVAYRANLAAHRRLRYLQVDASDDSRPILERLGFVAVTTTTPYKWSPAS